MAKTEAQAKASEKYRSESCHVYQVTFYPKDEALWEHLMKQQNKAEYIRGLIKSDMNEGAPR